LFLSTVPTLAFKNRVPLIPFSRSAAMTSALSSKEVTYLGALLMTLMKVPAKGIFLVHDSVKPGSVEADVRRKSGGLVVTIGFSLSGYMVEGQRRDHAISFGEVAEMAAYVW
jgi:hypothetical protein